VSDMLLRRHSKRISSSSCHLPLSRNFIRRLLKGISLNAIFFKSFYALF
jgi:hypothetical protein